MTVPVIDARDDSTLMTLRESKKLSIPLCAGYRSKHLLDASVIIMMDDMVSIVAVVQKGWLPNGVPLL